MPSAWTEHLKTYRVSHPTLSLKECMQQASKTYKKQSTNNQSKARSKTSVHKRSKALLTLHTIVKAINNMDLHVSNTYISDESRNQWREMQRMAREKGNIILEELTRMHKFASGDKVYAITNGLKELEIGIDTGDHNYFVHFDIDGTMTKNNFPKGGGA